MITSSSARTAEAVTAFDENFYWTYPHSNGFLDGGAAVVLGRVAGGRFELVRHDLADGARRLLCSLPEPDGLSAPPYPDGLAVVTSLTRVLFWDIALAAPVLAIGDREGVWIFDLERGGEPRLVYRPPTGSRIDALVSLRSDGRRLLASRITGDKERFATVEVDLETGRATELLEAGWWVSHAHYCPFDEAWVGICHEGDCTTIPDRVWGWHADKASRGVPLFDQHWDDLEKRLNVGHERWCFHDRSVLAVAYGVGPGRPRGIYEIFPDGRPARLVSEGDRDWHVAPSRDGRWAVVDTTGPHDAPGKGWDQAGRWSDIVLLDMETGRRLFLARSRQVRHPSHPHPVFSPDGRWIYYNEVDEACLRNRVMRVENPWAA